MKTYVINLTRRSDRLENMSAQLHRMGLGFERVAAFDARDASEAWLRRYFDDRGPLGVIPKGDQCCSLSHRRAWSTFLATDEPYAVILEDDVLLDAAAAEFLKSPNWIPAHVKLVKLEHFGPEGQRVLVGAPIAAPAGRSIAPIRSRHTGAAAYVISRRTAETLLALNARWSVPVDHLLFNPNVSPVAAALMPYQLLPAVARQTASFGGASDIRAWRIPFRRPSVALLRRELVRAFYELRPVPKQLALLLTGHAKLVRVGNGALSGWEPIPQEAPVPAQRGCA